TARLPGGPLPVLRRRRASPSPERAIEGADFRVAEEIGNLGQRVRWVTQVAQGELPARVVDQRLELHAVVFQSPLQRARTHGEPFPHRRELGFTVAHRFTDESSNRG